MVQRLLDIYKQRDKSHKTHTHTHTFFRYLIVMQNKFRGIDKKTKNVIRKHGTFFLVNPDTVVNAFHTRH